MSELTRTNPVSTTVQETALTKVVTTVGSVAVPLGAAWAIEAVDLVVGGALQTTFGIYPRSIAGLLGVLTAPLMHAGIGHLITNSVGFVLLAPMVLLTGRARFWGVTLISALTSGLGAWSLGWSGTYTVGASGVIFGYVGYLLAYGYFRRSVLAFVGSIAVATFFGSALLGMIPFLAGAAISWQAHLFGFLGGVLAAALFAGRTKKTD